MVNCLECISNASTCTKPKDGFYLLGNTPYACYSTCNTCSNGTPNGCLSCVPGKYLYKGECTTSFCEDTWCFLFGGLYNQSNLFLYLQKLNRFF